MTGHLEIVACGALARELKAVLRASGLAGVGVTCLPATLHNRPERITAAVQAAVRAARRRTDRVLCLYGDCGTGGALDAMLAVEGVERIPGAHCYDFLAGPDVIAALGQEQPGTFYLTDFLARHFERLVIAGLGIDRHPELLPLYFGHYVRVVHLAQTRDERLSRSAQAAADRLGLAFESRFTGLGRLAAFLTGPRPVHAGV